MNILSRKKCLLKTSPVSRLKEVVHQQDRDSEEHGTNNNELELVLNEKKNENVVPNLFCNGEFNDGIASQNKSEEELPSNNKQSSLIQSKNLMDCETDFSDNSDEFSLDDNNSSNDEYSPYILRTLLKLEKKHMPLRSTHHMASQTYFNNKSREKLILWMVDVHNKYCSYQQTLHIAVNILDRFCGVWVFKHHYQLYGVISLWIAAKYQEKSSCSAFSLWVKLTVVDRFGTSAINLTEELVLKSINFVVGLPTCVEFYYLLTSKRYANKCKNIFVDRMAEYFMDLSLVSEDNVFYSKLPSEVAAICLCLAEKITSNLYIDVSVTATNETPSIDVIDNNALLLISQAINPPEIIKKKYLKSEIGDPSMITNSWLKTQQHILVAMDAFLRNLRNPDAPDLTPLSPPNTPYQTHILPSAAPRKLQQ